jgi:hypothetical protein
MIDEDQFMEHTHLIVGCGGIGAWLAQALNRLLPKDVPLTLVDGDELEERNLDRQLFGTEDIGKPKAEALAEQLRQGSSRKIVAIPKYFERGLVLLGEQPQFYVAVDNHPARKAILFECDSFEGTAYFAGNEYWDAEAFRYHHSWSGDSFDPRTYYPEILTEKAGDPLQPACTGEAQEASPQLATANMSAANYAIWLWTFWEMKLKDTKDYSMEMAPIHIMSNYARVRTITMGDKAEDFPIERDELAVD